MLYYSIMSMFREHWIGGLTVYSIFFFLSLAVSISISIFFGLPFDWNPTISLNLEVIVGCFIVALLFGLWPDVDITSKSQKIFYTVLFVLNAALIFVFKFYIVAALLGLFAMLPILSRHRGWTHSRITMILLPGLFLVFPVYIEYPSWDIGWVELPDLLDSLLKWERLLDVLQDGLIFYLAGVIGYASHLYLDGILFRSRRAKGKR